MPHLLNLIEHNGTMLSNNHTPLIAHTGTEGLTDYTGLYGECDVMPITQHMVTMTSAARSRDSLNARIDAGDKTWGSR